MTKEEIIQRELDRRMNRFLHKADALEKTPLRKFEMSVSTERKLEDAYYNLIKSLSFLAQVPELQITPDKVFEIIALLRK